MFVTYVALQLKNGRLQTDAPVLQDVGRDRHPGAQGTEGRVVQGPHVFYDPYAEVRRPYGNSSRIVPPIAADSDGTLRLTEGLYEDHLVCRSHARRRARAGGIDSTCPQLVNHDSDGAEGDNDVRVPHD